LRRSPVLVPAVRPLNFGGFRFGCFGGGLRYYFIEYVAPVLISYGFFKKRLVLLVCDSYDFGEHFFKQSVPRTQAARPRRPFFLAVQLTFLFLTISDLRDLRFVICDFFKSCFSHALFLLFFFEFVLIKIKPIIISDAKKGLPFL